VTDKYTLRVVRYRIWPPGGFFYVAPMDGHRRPQQKLDKLLKHIIFRPSWQDISKLQTSITHSTAICYISRRTFKPLPRPPFESTSWHYKSTVNIWLPSIYRIHLLSRGSKKIRSLLKKDAKARTGCCQEGRKFGTTGNASRRNSGHAYQKLDNQLSELMLQ
jgi:hypothetical protein